MYRARILTVAPLSCRRKTAAGGGLGPAGKGVARIAQAPGPTPGPTPGGAAGWAAGGMAAMAAEEEEEKSGAPGVLAKLVMSRKGRLRGRALA